MQFPKARSASLVALVAISMGLAACSDDADDATADAGAEDGAHVCDVAPDYPSGPIELIVPWSAGGGTDQVARSLGNELSDALGVQVNVVNRTGGGGVVGHSAMADADNNGRSMGLVTAEIGMMHWQGLTDLNAEDLQAVSQVNADQAAVTVSADSEFETVDDLLAYIEENPGELTSSGTAQGGIGHLAMLGMLMGSDLPTDSVVWVPSDGAAPALQELVSGGVDFIVTSSIGEVRTMLEAGEVKTLAIMADEPDANYPEVPLLKDSDNDYVGGTWRGIVVPSGTDEKIVEELDCYIADIVKGEAFEEVMSATGFSIIYRGTDDFTQFMADYDASMGEIMGEAGLTD
ncbi:tripartite tricarboxylate transporter substrate binding protein [Flaviflexus salsibiostraticola]|uniref:Tripartite tricarboxylate transporter substrate binding protein n=1 Tax=Flaviflexus salsibiostraticola TaxID=1282737 RepID=A0A3S8Z9P3_9ACTO|nr:tripartite tricarboxylate transporter substrate binding protein [Flaviflexus salsibiostraticola]AZN30056.1 tripartite tricarboxylate transporter substrate binding protein [Flaviflexus salsibiostraticola]